MTLTDWLASTFGTTVILAALIGAFWKVIINHVTESVKSKYEKELATHKSALELESNKQLHNLKSQLEAANNKDIEQLKAQLRITAEAHNIKLTSIFEDQAKVIVTVYAQLIKLSEAIYKSIALRPTRLMTIDAKEADAINQMRIEFYEYFKVKKIYLPRQTSLKISEFESTVSRIKVLFDINMTSYQVDNAIRTEKQMETYDQLHQEIPNALKLLEDDFQRILGFPIDEAKPAN